MPAPEFFLKILKKYAEKRVGIVPGSDSMMNYNKANNNIIINAGDSLTINDIEVSWHCINDALKHYPDRIIINLSELTSIDSAGIGFLVKVHKKTRIYCIDLLFTGMSDSLKRLFFITGILPFFNVIPLEEFDLSVMEYSLY